MHLKEIEPFKKYITLLCLCQVSGFGLNAGFFLVLVFVPGPLLFNGVNVEINSNLTL